MDNRKSFSNLKCWSYVDLSKWFFLAYAFSQVYDARVQQIRDNYNSVPKLFAL